MKNFLDNGTVLPSGLLSESINSRIEGFNKSYRDTPLRAGVVVAAYSVNDPLNRTQLATEYDVVTTQQNEDRGSTTIRYRNCLSSDDLGGIADYFEKNFRIKTQQSYTGQAIRFAGQDGSIVLLLCLDGASNKAMIIGGFPHPDRETTLVDTQPRLQGEYNGVNVAVNPDGSTALTFNGATDSDGNVIDSSQGVTTAQIETDGTLQLQNSEITVRMDRTAKVLTLSSTGDWTVNIQGNTNITTSGDTNITTTGITTIKGEQIDLNISNPVPGNGILTSDSSYGIVDTISGLPLMPSQTIFGDV